LCRSKKVEPGTLLSIGSKQTVRKRNSYEQYGYRTDCTFTQPRKGPLPRSENNLYIVFISILKETSKNWTILQPLFCCMVALSVTSEHTDPYKWYGPCKSKLGEIYVCTGSLRIKLLCFDVIYKICVLLCGCLK
jgi:hypothetical protein